MCTPGHTRTEQECNFSLLRLHSVPSYSLPLSNYLYCMSFLFLFLFFHSSLSLFPLSLSLETEEGFPFFLSKVIHNRGGRRIGRSIISVWKVERERDRHFFSLSLSSYFSSLSLSLLFEEEVSCPAAQDGVTG